VLKIKKVFVHVHGVVRFERFYSGTAQEVGVGGGGVVVEFIEGPSLPLPTSPPSRLTC
jgi:hypothetical protein